MNIGQVARDTGVSPKMIRYYETVGLLNAVQRTKSGYRTYTDNDVQTLHFIRRARDLGFAVAEIQELLALWRDKNRASEDVKRLTQQHIDDLEKKLRVCKRWQIHCVI